MAATIRTASRTTASLSDAKNLKTEPRCQGGRTEEIVAMVGRAVSTRNACDSTLTSSPSPVRDRDDVTLKLSLRDPSTPLGMTGKSVLFRSQCLCCFHRRPAKRVCPRIFSRHHPPAAKVRFISRGALAFCCAHHRPPCISHPLF